MQVWKFCGVTTLALSSMTAMSVQAAVPSFGDVDGDQNGYISNDEASKVPGLLEIFTRLDANQDGMITQEEYAALTVSQPSESTPGAQ